MVKELGNLNLRGIQKSAQFRDSFLWGLCPVGFCILRVGGRGGCPCMMDRGKGINKAVQQVFGGSALIQGSQWHKRENVVSYLPKGRQVTFKTLLQPYPPKIVMGIMA
jgi:hypothetical protein